MSLVFREQRETRVKFEDDKVIVIQIDPNSRKELKHIYPADTVHALFSYIEDELGKR